MEDRKVTSSQTTLTQLSRKEIICRKTIQSRGHTANLDDTPIGQDERHLLSLPMVNEEQMCNKANGCVTPIGKMHTVDECFRQGFKREIYEDSQSDDSDDM